MKNCEVPSSGAVEGILHPTLYEPIEPTLSNGTRCKYSFRIFTRFKIQILIVTKFWTLMSYKTRFL